MDTFGVIEYLFLVLLLFWGMQAAASGIYGGCRVIEVSQILLFLQMKFNSLVAINRQAGSRSVPPSF